MDSAAMETTHQETMGRWRKPKFILKFLIGSRKTASAQGATGNEGMATAKGVGSADVGTHPTPVTKAPVYPTLNSTPLPSNGSSGEKVRTWRRTSNAVSFIRKLTGRTSSGNSRQPVAAPEVGRPTDGQTHAGPHKHWTRSGHIISFLRRLLGKKATPVPGDVVTGEERGGTSAPTSSCAPSGLLDTTMGPVMSSHMCESELSDDSDEYYYSEEDYPPGYHTEGDGGDSGIEGDRRYTQSRVRKWRKPRTVLRMMPGSSGGREGRGDPQDGPSRYSQDHLKKWRKPRGVLLFRRSKVAAADPAQEEVGRGYSKSNLRHWRKPGYVLRLFGRKGGGGVEESPGRDGRQNSRSHRAQWRKPKNVLLMRGARPGEAAPDPGEVTSEKRRMRAATWRQTGHVLRFLNSLNGVRLLPVLKSFGGRGGGPPCAHSIIAPYIFN